MKNKKTSLLVLAALGVGTLIGVVSGMVASHIATQVKYKKLLKDLDTACEDDDECLFEDSEMCDCCPECCECKESEEKEILEEVVEVAE